MKLFLVLMVALLSLGAFAGPKESCLNSLSRYDWVAPLMKSKCARANVYSAQVVEAFSKMYPEFNIAVMDIVLEVRNAKEANCYISMAKKYGQELDMLDVRQRCLR